MHTTGSANSEADEARSNVSGTHGGCDARSERHVKCIAKRALRNAFVPALLSLAVTDPAVAQSTAAQNATPPACATAEHRQFDFWIGDWEVRDPQGKIVGHNRIERAHEGCVLIEHWTSVARVTGTSVNVYDRDRGRWHQTWVDSGGGLLQLNGALVANAMVLAGEAVDADAPSRRALQRITWTPQPNGDVRQLWESSTDGGKTWNVVFEGRYTKRT